MITFKCLKINKYKIQDYVMTYIHVIPTVVTIVYDKNDKYVTLLCNRIILC